MSSKIAKLEFSREAVGEWKMRDEKHGNWPVVYILDDGRKKAKGTSRSLRDIYVGESLNAAARMKQHLDTPAKQHLKNIRVIIDERFNKSVCLDLESYLIKMVAGDGANRVLNRNNGITEAQYYQREVYRESFRNIFERLRHEGVFTRGIAEIENSSLFKLSPFKALTEDQADSVDEIVRGLLNDLERNAESTMVIQGDPGTGKTVVAIYIIKLLMDIRALTSIEDLEGGSRFSNFFTEANRELLEHFRIGLVVPQQSLREAVKKVFRKTPGLSSDMVLTPFQVGEADGIFDLLLVDEAHRLNQRAAQAVPKLNTKFVSINKELFGEDDIRKTQLDWLKAKSRHQVFLLDTAQSVRPADLPLKVLSDLIFETRAAGRWFQLRTQMRVKAGSDYVSYIRWILDPHPQRFPEVRKDFGDYDLRSFDSVTQMRDEIFRREADVGLSRVVSGYAWEWKSRHDLEAFDIEIEDLRLRWNSTSLDWINSRNALEEVGCIHVVQGYDLNYVGVIIGSDLRFDLEQKRFFIDRKFYFDKRGMQNNKVLGQKFSDDDILKFITQIYAVLMTRGMRGTYVYAHDLGLREYLRQFIPSEL